MQPEAVFSSKFRKRVEALPKTWAAKIVMSSKSGTPDWLLCVNGKFIGVELKMRGNGPTKLQQYQIKEIKNAGGLAIVVYHDTLEEAIEAIKSFGGI